jgi:hypothetical protein
MSHYRSCCPVHDHANPVLRAEPGNHTLGYRTVLVGEGNKTGECLLRSHVVPDAGNDPLLTSSGPQI